MRVGFPGAIRADYGSRNNRWTRLTLPTDKALYLYCTSAAEQTTSAAAITLQDTGFMDVYAVVGTMEARDRGARTLGLLTVAAEAWGSLRAREPARQPA